MRKNFMFLAFFWIFSIPRSLRPDLMSAKRRGSVGKVKAKGLGRDPSEKKLFGCEGGCGKRPAWQEIDIVLLRAQILDPILS